MRSRRWLLLALLLIVVVGLLPPVNPAAAAPPYGPPSGWVKANVVGGGCDAQGHCSSDVTPGSPTLYEYKPDRQSVGRNYNVGANLADHGGYATFVDREKCHIDNTDYYWSAGIWHHGGYWTLTFDASGDEHWSGPSRQHWAFEHNDVCEPIGPTETPVPPPTATQPPGEPTWTPAPPTDTPVPPSPTVSGPNCNPDGSINIHPEYTYWTPSINGVTLPQSAPGKQLSLSPGSPLTDIEFSFSQNPLNAGDPSAPFYDTHGWNHQSIVITGTTAIELPWTRAMLVWDFEKYTDHGETGRMLTIDNSHTRAFSAPSPGRWRPLPRMEASRPPISFTSSLSDLPPGQYVLISKTYRDACNPSFNEQRFYFYIGENLWQPSPTPFATLTPTITPSPTATPTPLPPPPPVPDAAFKVSIHSTLDPRSEDSDVDNAVYKSNGNQIAWPAGEVLDFTPRVQITLSPSTPSYAGYRFRAHVRDWSYVSSIGQKAATATDAMGRQGCRGSAATSTGEAGAVCTYDYIGGSSLSDATEPTEADMASQAHVYWAVGKPRTMRPDVYVYSLSSLQHVDLKVEVRIVVEVVNVATGQVVDSRTDTTTGTFVVALVVPRSVK
jgi:hypothetical protein